jgi:hypothetical protein
MINEWKAPDLQDLWYFRFYLVALVMLISFAKSAVTWTERLLIVFFLNAALTHMRHISLMLMALTPFIARMISTHFGKFFRRRIEHEGKQQIQMSARTGPLATAIIALILLISGSIDHRSIEFLKPAQIFRVEAEQLNQLVDYLDKSLPTGKMFNEYALGGYLLYAITPPPKVFIDGRADMYGEQILTDYNNIRSTSSEREGLLEKYEIDWVVFQKDSDLVKDLKKSGSWLTTFENDYYEVLTRGTSATSQDSADENREPNIVKDI